MNGSKTYDLIVLGAGPAGLEMGLKAAQLGLDFLILESGSVAQNIKSWGFVQLFTPWKMNVSELGKKAISSATIDNGFDEDSVCIGDDYVQKYLLPISRSLSLSERIRENTHVLKVARKGAFKNSLIGDSSRDNLPFVVMAEVSGDSDGAREVYFEARNVVDATGVYGNHRWLGTGGAPCCGERQLAKMPSGKISYVLENFSLMTNKLNNKKIVLVGNGFSACTILESLIELKKNGCNVKVVWITATDNNQPVELIKDDPLPYRGKLARMANDLVSANNDWLEFLPDQQIEAVETGRADSPVRLSLRNQSDKKSLSVEAGYIYALIGYIPDRSIYEELQIHECWATSGPMKLAASLLAQSGGDCLTLQSSGPETLLNPEAGFYIIGAKSYGRNPQFLIERLREQISAVGDFVAERLDLKAVSAS